LAPIPHFVWTCYGVDGGLMLRRLTNNPFLGVRFSRRAEEPKQDTTKISQQIALSSGLEVVWMLRLYRYLSISLPCAIVANTTAQRVTKDRRAGGSQRRCLPLLIVSE
jgi:hypothetical protein